MAEEIAGRDEVLALLSVAARKGHVGAARLLLNEIKRDEKTAAEEARKLTLVPDPEPEDFIDELAKRAKDERETDV